MKKNYIVYPGFFDPITLGHVNLVERAKDVFQNVVIAVSRDSSKNSLFTLDERFQLIQTLFLDDPHVVVETFEGLLVHYLAENNYPAVLRGLRTVSDFEYEFQMAKANKTMRQKTETFFMMTDSRYSFISSTLIKEIARLGGNITGMVPDIVQASLKEKFQHV